MFGVIKGGKLLIDPWGVDPRQQALQIDGAFRGNLGLDKGREA